MSANLGLRSLALACLGRQFTSGQKRAICCLPGDIDRNATCEATRGHSAKFSSSRPLQGAERQLDGNAGADKALNRCFQVRRTGARGQQKDRTAGCVFHRLVALNPTAVRLLTTDTSSDKSLNKKDQLKRAVKDYGSTVIVFHVTISLASLGFFYLIVSSGLDVVSLVSKLPLVGNQLENSQVAVGASMFVMAYAVHKVFAPLRISITLTATPFLVRYLRSKGILKVKRS